MAAHRDHRVAGLRRDVGDLVPGVVERDELRRLVESIEGQPDLRGLLEVVVEFVDAVIASHVAFVAVGGFEHGHHRVIQVEPRRGVFCVQVLGDAARRVILDGRTTTRPPVVTAGGENRRGAGERKHGRDRSPGSPLQATGGIDARNVGRHFAAQGVGVAVGTGGAVGHPSGVDGFHCDREGSMRGVLATTS